MCHNVRKLNYTQEYWAKPQFLRSEHDVVFIRVCNRRHKSLTDGIFENEVKVLALTKRPRTFIVPGWNMSWDALSWDKISPDRFFYRLRVCIRRHKSLTDGSFENELVVLAIFNYCTFNPWLFWMSKCVKNQLHSFHISFNVIAYNNGLPSSSRYHLQINFIWWANPILNWEEKEHL